MKRGLLKILAVWLLTIFVGNYVYVAMFSHTHYLDGETITHAHPFASGHNHTTAEYSLLQSVYSAFYLSSEFCGDIAVAFIEIDVAYCHYEEVVLDDTYLYGTLRAPPISLV